METHQVCIRLGGVPVRLHYHHEQLDFRPFAVDDTPLTDVYADGLLPALDARFPADYSPAMKEQMALICGSGSALLPFGRGLFHAAAMLWRGRAWLYTAPPGTGKTTQCILWRQFFGEEAAVLNGDKPVLEVRDDRTVWVHSSPWMGKERFGIPGACAPLGGIIMLQQAPENSIKPLSPRESIIPVLSQFFFGEMDSAAAAYMTDMEDAMLTRAPVFLLENKADEESVLMTRRALEALI